MQQQKDPTLSALPENKAKINLSPFTWNHLTLPPLIKAYNSIQIKFGIQKGDEKLATIKEAKQRIKNFTASLSKKQQKQQKPKSKQQHMNKTTVGKSAQQMQKVNKNESDKKQNKKQVTKTIHFINNIQKKQKVKNLNQTSHTQRYIKTQWLRNDQRYSKHTQIQKSQPLTHYSNNIQGILNLTNKNRFSEEMKVKGKQFYPLSFLIPKDIEVFMLQNNKIAVKSMLRRISLQILQYLQSQNMKGSSWSNTLVHIGDILESDVIKTSSQYANSLVKMCMYLQNIRVQQKYHYFQRFPSYFKINIKPKPNFFKSLIRQAVHYLDGAVELLLKIHYRSIDFRLLVLILHYDSLFKQYESTYDSPHQLWIVKGFASQKQNYITILKSSSQLCYMEQSNVIQSKINKKYENKVIQKYLADPYLLTAIPVFSERKFTIKQPVLVIGNGKTYSLYKYQTAYSRFASHKYDCSKLQREIHLTNFQELHENNAMLIQQLFQTCKQDLRAKYSQQSADIIKRVINNTKGFELAFQYHKLFVFDFFVDSNGRLYLLDINLGTSKLTSKHQKISQESQMMMKTLKQLVTMKNDNTEKWIKLSGSELRHQGSEIVPLSQIQVKPFYKCRLEQGQSLIQLIRLRRRIFSRFTILVRNFLNRIFLDKLKGYQNQGAEIKDKDNKYEAEDRGQIRFLQQRQLSNT